MLVDEECKLLCETDPIPKDDAKYINDLIQKGYAFNWNVDGLPAANEQIDPQTDERYYNIGFKLGSMIKDTAYLNNHYDIIIHYHAISEELSRVVGVSVNPFSKNTKPNHACAKGLGNFHLSEDGKSQVVYTYSVTWLVKSKKNNK
jgi:transmembrane 9 superfamily protein 2/4